MDEQLYQSPVTSDMDNFMLPSSAANFLASETFPYNQNLVWEFPQMTSHDGQSASISTRFRRQHSHLKNTGLQHLCGFVHAIHGHCCACAITDGGDVHYT
jgi:hypothetical protein